jgi:glutamate dehydrogenase
VKASTESNADAGDRANDMVRVNAADLRAKVVGEGANLGFTQRGRIEAALAGRRINTDALDNSAGVDTSDHEVNIKIALGGIEGGPPGDRAALLFGMTDEVAGLVLRHNYQQSQAISVAEAQAGDEHDRLERFMRALERPEGGKPGRLDRVVEFLPDSVAMRARGQSRQYLTRPELSVLLATPSSISATISCRRTCRTIQGCRTSCCATSPPLCSRTSRRRSGSIACAARS